MRDFPDSLETNRLIIRAPRVGDGLEVNEAIIETLENLKLWMPWVFPVPRVEDTEENIRGAVANFITRKDLRLNIYSKETGRLIGCSGLQNIDWDIPKFEIGYWVRKSFEGQGYITEAVEAITKFAIDTLGAKRIEIRCDSKNIRSRKVAENLGFNMEAILRKSALNTSGEVVDTCIFAKIWE
jgi:RimJ/RimL family protein N-acetyltransferase